MSKCRGRSVTLSRKVNRGSIVPCEGFERGLIHGDDLELTIKLIGFELVLYWMVQLK
jgi:hypothetical protein